MGKENKNIKRFNNEENWKQYIYIYIICTAEFCFKEPLLIHDEYFLLVLVYYIR